MKDDRCVRFLQWALPRLHMSWSGFRKVRKQVCKRIDRRLRDLGLDDVGQYERYLDSNADEWLHLDTLCRITISRFGRDKAVFAALTHVVLPELVQIVRARGGDTLHVWSAGCASGEEPYTLSLLWETGMRRDHPDITMRILATDADAHMLKRARDARYNIGSLKELAATIRDQSFTKQDDTYTIDPACRRNVTFLQQDIRRVQPEGPFDLVLCRNLVFTYFDECLQRDLATRMIDALHEGGALVIGIHEQLPESLGELAPWRDHERIYRKLSDRDRTTTASD